MSLRARLLWVFIIALAVAALSATTALAMPNLGDLSWRTFGTSLSIACYLLGITLCAFVIERRRFRVLMAISVAGFAASLLSLWGLIWIDTWYSYWSFATRNLWYIEEILRKSFLSTTLSATILLIIGLLGLLKPSGAPARLTRVATETMCGAFALLSTLILWEVFEQWWLFPSEQIMRVWNGLLILSIAGLLGTPALRALEIARRKDAAETGLPMQIKVQLTCPRCKHEQTIHTGGVMCVQCGLSIKVDVEEPLCPKCGYSLARLDVDTCPECDHDVKGVG